MSILFDDQMWVSYRFAYFGSVWDSPDPPPDLFDHVGGQSNGLCGGAIPGMLMMLTGLHTGEVPFRLEVLEKEPPVGDQWEEVVEASLRDVKTAVTLSTFASEWWREFTLPAAGDYRARYSASGMDESDDPDRQSEEPERERYLLQLWPAPPSPDVVLRVTSDSAKGWHAHARSTPAPPVPTPPLTPEQIQARDWADAERREQQMREMVEAHILQSWGGRPPTPRLQALTAIEANGLASMDRDLVDLIAAQSEPEQHRIALWAAARAHALVEEPYAARLAPALDAVRRGHLLPAPFDSQEGAFDRLFDTAPGTTTTVAVAVTGDDSPTRPTSEVVALFAILAAARPDPLDAVLSSVRYGLLGEIDVSSYLAEVRREVRRFT